MNKALRVFVANNHIKVSHLGCGAWYDFQLTETEARRFAEMLLEKATLLKVKKTANSSSVQLED